MTHISRSALVDWLHHRLAEIAPCRVLGQPNSPAGHRANVGCVLPSPILVYWNVDKN